MAYLKTALASDAQGFFRFLGKDPATGKPVRFRLGRDRHEATIRSAKLLQLWEANQPWTPQSLGVAKAIARGQQTIAVADGRQDPIAHAWTVEQHSQQYGNLITVSSANPAKQQQGESMLSETALAVKSLLPVLQTNDVGPGTIHQAFNA